MYPSAIIIPIFTLILGGLISWFIAIKMKKAKDPIHFFKMNRLIAEGETEISNISNLKVTYKNENVYNFSSTFLAFWNNGKETITRDMIVETLSFVMNENCMIFDAQIVYCTDQSNEFAISVSEDKTNVKLDFKYLDYKQGVVIQIFSNVTSTHEHDFCGVIMGARRLYSPKKSDKRLFFHLINLGVLMLASAWVLWEFFELPENFTLELKDMPIAAIATYIIVLLWNALSYPVVSWFLNSNRKMPKGFKKFFP